MSHSRPHLARVRRIVVKLGTGLLTAGPGQIDRERIAATCDQIAGLRSRGLECLVVSSGAVGLGMARLNLTRRPRELARVQACAAIGQGQLIQTWQDGFTPRELTVAQVLLTHEDLRHRHRHLAAKETFDALFRYGVIPVVNENDTVSAEEIRFGDNDILAAMVASLVGAQALVILSTVPGLIDRSGTGSIVPVVDRITPEIEKLAGGTESQTSVGGMVSKVAAAKVAVRAGCATFLASGTEPDVITRILAGENPGTFFVPSGLPLEAKKRWLAFFQRPRGVLHLDAGAVSAIMENGKSLLASGITGFSGAFEAGETIDLAGPDGLPFARGTTAFGSAEVEKIRRKSSAELKTLFPDRRRLEVVHRDALVLL